MLAFDPVDVGFGSIVLLLLVLVAIIAVPALKSLATLADPGGAQPGRIQSIWMALRDPPEATKSLAALIIAWYLRCFVILGILACALAVVVARPFGMCEVVVTVAAGILSVALECLARALLRRSAAYLRMHFLLTWISYAGFIFAIFAHR